MSLSKPEIVSSTRFLGRGLSICGHAQQSGGAVGGTNTGRLKGICRGKDLGCDGYDSGGGYHRWSDISPRIFG